MNILKDLLLIPLKINMRKRYLRIELMEMLGKLERRRKDL
jgi:hypothetical protein